ncbi:type IV pilus assembly protein PilM [Patescibacteria group bacterium]|nr:type IV pilus assembly protein PilM [Patescibacteria group bacterium]MDE2011220.1 type IV pilus assembly protein PilM [Patescibacteria group bacterium]MDE2233636.1 type IV pilus assembly protein PilM [Patescibacteria group bacterium]
MSFFSSIFKKEISVLGLDIGSSAIKVVQLKKKRGRAVLETYGELALGPYAGVEIGRATSLPIDKTVEAVRDILREAKTTTVSCGAALPLASSLISFINVPPVPDKQLGEVISLEARKYIPVPLSEVMLDYSIIPREESYADNDAGGAEQQSKDALVVAIHNEFVNNYQSIMAGTGLAPSFYEIEIFSCIRAVVDQGVSTCMIIDFGARATKLYIVERGMLRSSHIINKGSQDITLSLAKAMSVSISEAENMKRVHGLKGGPEYKELSEIITVNLDYMFYEANSTLLNYQKKYRKNVAKVILTGGGALLKGFTDLAKIGFQTEVIYADPFNKLETPAFLAEEFAQAGPEFAVAIGVALRRLSELE